MNKLRVRFTLLLAIAAAAMSPQRSNAQPAGREAVRSSASATASDDAPAQRRPYRIKLLISSAQDAPFTSRFRARLIDDLDVLIHRAVGDPWRCEVVDAGADLNRLLRWSLKRADDDFLNRHQTQGHDKLLLVHMRWQQGRFELSGRELDLATRLWGPPTHGSVAGQSRLDRDVLALCLSVFSPIGFPTRNAQRGRLDLTIQAAALAARDPSVQLVKPGDLYRLVRLFPGDATAPAQPILWTYLTVESVASGTAQCRLLSALSSPTTRRAAGSRLVALAARPPHQPTRLRLLSHRRQPLAGYEVLIGNRLRPDEQLRTTTDLQGWITIPAGPELVSVDVRSGTHSLARLWVLPGIGDDGQEIAVRDDPVLLQVESRVTALQDALIDEVVKRTLAIRRVHALMDRNQWQRAERLLAQLAASLEPFERRLAQTRADALNQARQRGEESVDPKIDRMLTQTQKYIEIFLDPKVVRDLNAEYRSRKGPSQGL